MQPCGFFVVMRDDLPLFWDGGEGWTEFPLAARRFSGPPDAYADCYLAVSCLRRLGHACGLAYLPSRAVRSLTKVMPRLLQVPGHGAPQAVR